MVETSYNYQLLSCYVFAQESIAPLKFVSHVDGFSRRVLIIHDKFKSGVDIF